MDADRINRAIDHASESNRFILPLRETMRRTIRFRIASPAARAPFADRRSRRMPPPSHESAPARDAWRAFASSRTRQAAQRAATIEPASNGAAPNRHMRIPPILST
ncbi:hypothetical protein AQ802_17825 [Burkholderia pseudomallei]|uniref:Uncharacterized protein n=1 Tax=Burkholderia pseudomallei (strain 1710b) TaxID=320372 RepID=Q3JFR4_BURP1|nr:hypothetical protein BURPS1710b_A2439 [Burkholderia pseudomallei 1710b]ALB11486.1 hypothetical protein ACT79_12150 [Burkholderia pseudomallei]EEH26220.1 hypothetical protein BUH_5483 [Burkholderia pseudomallei Pakistan 9]OAB14873.1 hypothetical protein AQ846_13950 [Burkholderia pseudomallei]OMR47390.1 hypothetical protein AQ725_07185 [Burkholderia pseudomallei]